MKSIIQKAPVLHQLVELLQTKEVSDPKVFHQAKRVVADTTGTAYGGIKTDAFQTAINTNNDFFGSGNYPVWGVDETTNLLGSVFFNALSISSTDFDEGHRKAAGHPASLVVPVALILGEKLGKTYTEMLKAVVIGYEAGTRFSYARYPEKVDTYSSGRWGAIASAATGAYLLGLNTEEFMHALSLAYVLSPAMQGGSTDVSTGSMSKEGVPWAAQSGLQSALLAQNGFAGPYLFIDAYDEIDKTKLIADSNTDWLIQSNYFKPFACCRWLHTAINLVIELKNDHLLAPEKIETIEVSIFERALNLIESKYPESVIQAQFHLPFTMACALLFDKVTPDEVSKKNLGNRSIHDIIDLIKLAPDERYSKPFPLKLGSKVLVKMKSGEAFSKSAMDAPWDASDPPSDEALFKKFKDLVGQGAEAIWKKYLQ
jgi:2-methylcitrate dehydratase PrpD